MECNKTQLRLGITYIFMLGMTWSRSSDKLQVPVSKIYGIQFFFIIVPAKMYSEMFHLSCFLNF